MSDCMGGVWYGFGKAVGELPFGRVEWFFGSRHVWRQDRWMVVELLIHCAIWGGWNMDFSGSWWWTWVWGEARGGPLCKAKWL